MGKKLSMGIAYVLGGGLVALAFVLNGQLEAGDAFLTYFPAGALVVSVNMVCHAVTDIAYLWKTKGR